MTKFWRGFIPYQLWRFVVINTKMHLIVCGLVGQQTAKSAEPRTIPRRAPL